jgi:hypothetical protein
MPRHQRHSGPLSLRTVAAATRTPAEGKRRFR